MRSVLFRLWPPALLALVGVSVVLLILLWSATPGHALPEYAARTNESCATCHVSPGGGGPRTLRGMLWAARGKPDQVPDLPGVLIAPGVSDGAELYDITCAACHGARGEGLFGVALTNSGLPDNKVRTQILNGRVRSGMPAFKGKFTAQQLDALVKYVAGLASGDATPPPPSYRLAPGKLQCVPSPENAFCGGN